MTYDKPPLKQRMLRLKDIGSLSIDECSAKNIELTLTDKQNHPRVWNYSAKKFGTEFFPGGKRFFSANHACKWWFERESCWQGFQMVQQDTRSVVLILAGHPYTLQIPDKANTQPPLVRAPDVPSPVGYGTTALQQIYKHRELADFKIIDEENKTHLIHTQVLLPLWPYLATVVQSGMTEAQERTLKLEFPSNVMELILGFLYGTVSKIPEELALELLIPSKVYFLEALERAVEATVTGSSLEGDRCLISWQTAKQADNQVIRDYCSCYFLEHVGQQATAYLCPNLSPEELAEFQTDLNVQRARQLMYEE
ncbi:hypothetical protein CJU90_3553 [Yarrowia sp. C11]|nr:hypothetical protein CKK34_5168 [Yarrowia sp. E02]KAG5367294.1 hypothetical protein CJU90_3553 [Yarrowia sp. C11]